MHDCARALLGEDPRQQRAVGDVALVERHALRHREAKARDEVVYHRDRPAGVLQREHRMAADIAGAPRHQHWNPIRHLAPPSTPHRTIQRLMARPCAVAYGGTDISPVRGIAIP